MSKVLVDDPLPYSAGYTLNLYCRYHNVAHGYRDGVGEFYAQTFAQCARAARRWGWIIHKDRTATCPRCNDKHTKP